MNIENGRKPAFPVESHEEIHAGISKREYFAAMILQGLVSASDRDGNWTGVDASAALQAVKEADLLLEALDKESTQ